MEVEVCQSAAVKIDKLLSQRSQQHCDNNSETAENRDDCCDIQRRLTKLLTNNPRTDGAPLRLSLSDVRRLKRYLCNTTVSNADNTTDSQVECSVADRVSAENDRVGDECDTVDKTGDVLLRSLLAGCRMVLPAPTQPARNPELEARCQRLRNELQEKEYQSMVNNVCSKPTVASDVNMAKELREVNAQLVEVAQMVFSVVAAFAFGFVAASMSSSSSSSSASDLSRQILSGLAAAAVVFIAEIYFLVRYLSRN